MVADYNHHMGGVDVADQYLCYYGIAKKTRKWWKHIAFRLLDMAIVNAYIIYRHNTRSTMDQLQFRLHLAEKLAIPLIESKAQIAVPRTSVNQFTRLMGKHSPQSSQLVVGVMFVATRRQAVDREGTQKLTIFARVVNCFYV